VEGDSLSRTQWEEFTKSTIWGSILWEIADREKYLIDLFKENDQVWNADTVRGKLTELEYIRQIPKSLLASIIIKEANANNKGDTDGKA
jgi:hypothetical protein